MGIKTALILAVVALSLLFGLSILGAFALIFLANLFLDAGVPYLSVKTFGVAAAILVLLVVFRQ